MTHPSVDALWDCYRAYNPDAPPEPADSFHFCDNREDADTCLRLVLEGKKRATAASVLEYERVGDPIPKPGDCSVVTDFDGVAKAVIRTTHVEIKRFADVDEEFARAEGEGDLTLEWWRKAHRAYFLRMLKDTPELVNDDLLIACEHFEVVMVG